MRIDPSNLGPELETFLAERHLATLSTHRDDGSIHVAPVGFTYDPATRLARIITWSGSRKVRNLDDAPGQQVALCQVEGRRWVTLEGRAEVTAAHDRVAEAVERYTHRYRQPGERTDRVAIEIAVERIMGHF